MKELFEIVHEDDDLLVLNKPADLVCHPTKGDRYSSLISRVRLHLGDDIRPHLINRLDRETSGLVIVARNETAALELRRLWEGGPTRRSRRRAPGSWSTGDRGSRRPNVPKPTRHPTPRSCRPAPP
jgi:23S rRNA-/tRNA-specific pseudouridylate synthase